MSKKTKEMIIAAVILLVMILMSIAKANLSSIGLVPSSNAVIFTIISLNVILLILVVFLVTRNVVKLMLERRRGVLGTRLRTKLVVAFVTLTIIPTAVLFFASVVFLNRSMEGWLSTEVESAIEESMNVANIYYKEASVDAIHYANSIAKEITERRLLKEENLNILSAMLKEKMDLFRLSSVVIFSSQEEELVKIISPDIQSEVMPSPESSNVQSAMHGKSLSMVLRKGKADIIEGIVPIRSSFNPADVVGVLVVDYYVPESLSGRLSLIKNSFSDYSQILRLKGPIKTNYIILLTSVTLLVIFSAVWFALNIAKGLLNPIEKLVEGTQRISKGDLGFRIDVKANDELGILVDDFNIMVDDIKTSRKNLESAYNEISARNRYIMTVLNTISTGVITINHDGRIALINPSAQTLLGLVPDKVLGRPAVEVLSGEYQPIFTELVEGLKKARTSTISKQLSVSVDGKWLTLMGQASPLHGDNDESIGALIVFDDLTQLLRMQRMAAWREVARRIAHEVKNPLTPIQLSAQRLRRRYLDKLGDEAEVFDECTRVIINEVDVMKRLVNEFSAFAKMPTSMPVPDDLNKVVADSVALYRQAHHEVEYVLELDDRMPRVDIDSSQMNRALGNLLENATTAVREGNGSLRRITVKSAYEPELHIATLDIIDTGPGIPKTVKDRMFEPYFSTKKGGTGLGLVIVNRIIADHNGFIRVRDNEPQGTIFSVELPVKE
ncbi:MAG TPA: ATP-binding protein [Deltaproteobacteria bacterium]|nr:ATP-binding protein [Deltaproteobacteria bacterium]HPR55675.1 ATP-binding protein [Deltaproteobacteria bacterium]HXK48077.1 ATP-binding protein [Deltaproteobacteria bacterium]